MVEFGFGFLNVVLLFFIGAMCLGSSSTGFAFPAEVGLPNSVGNAEV